MFKEKEDVPAMSIAALEKKYRCIIEVDDKNQGNAAAARRARQTAFAHKVYCLILFLKIYLKHSCRHSIFTFNFLLYQLQ